MALTNAGTLKCQAFRRRWRRPDDTLNEIIVGILARTKREPHRAAPSRSVGEDLHRKVTRTRLWRP